MYLLNKLIWRNKRKGRNYNLLSVTYSCSPSKQQQTPKITLAITLRISSYSVTYNPSTTDDDQLTKVMRRFPPEDRFFALTGKEPEVVDGFHRIRCELDQLLLDSQYLRGVTCLNVGRERETAKPTIVITVDEEILDPTLTDEDKEALSALTTLDHVIYRARRESIQSK